VNYNEDLDKRMAELREHERKSRKRLKWLQCINWGLFTLNTYDGISNLLSGNYWLGALCVLAVGFTSWSIVRTDHILKQRFIERE
jgi:hypothetical protein